MPAYYVRFVLGACLLFKVIAVPQISFPLNDQAPPAAIVNDFFQFTFSSRTFTSSHNISYLLLDPPDWIHLDEATRTLAGTPRAEDTGNAQIQIQATDLEGKTTVRFILLVLALNSVKIRQDIFMDRLRKAGSIFGLSTLLLYPQTAFRLELGDEVFESETPGLQYYATSFDSTPLPAWLAFDTSNIVFNGTTPALLTPQSSPQIFGFSLGAGQVPGFWQALLTFEISVASHILTFVEPNQQFNLTSGESLVIPSLLRSLRRDGVPIDSTAVISSSANQPTWLKLESQDLSFTGVVPQESGDIDFQLSVIDDQNNEAVLQISLSTEKGPTDLAKQVNLQGVNATRGSFFTYSFQNVHSVAPTQKLNIKLEPATSWLIFTAVNSTVHGNVPDDAQLELVEISLTIMEDQKTRQIIHLPINVRSADTTAMPTDPRAPEDTQDSNTSNGGSGPNTSFNPNAISLDDMRSLVLKIFLPLLVAAILLIVILLLLRRMRKKLTRPVITDSSITSASQSMYGSVEQLSSDTIVSRAETSSSGTHSNEMPSSPPPRVDLAWSIRHQLPSRFATLGNVDDRSTPTTRSSWSSLMREVDNQVADGLRGNQNQVQCVPVVRNSDTTERGLVKQSLLKRFRKPCTNAVVAGSSNKVKKEAGFNGRRSNTMGHGAGFAPSNKLIPQMTLRQVPLSPLSEQPANHQSLSKTNQKQREYDDSTSMNVLFSQHSRSTRIRSIASSESRYDDPDDESSLGPHVHGHSELNESHDYSITWADGDWQTESGASISDSKRRDSGGWSGNLGSRRGNLPAPPAPPTSRSYGENIDSQWSGQSQTNSLRFV